MAEKQVNQDLTNFEVEIGAEGKNDYPELPEFVYLPAKFNKVDKKVTKTGDRARFEFSLVGKYEGRKAWSSVPLHKVVSENMGLYQWFEMLLGRRPEEGEKFRFMQFQGKLYMIVLENSKNTDSNGKHYQNVNKVRPMTEEEMSDLGISVDVTTDDVENKEVAINDEVAQEESDKVDSPAITEDDLPF